ncbi:MAG: glycosyltransferase family 2 protein, partial [Nannocystaceae bacterium]|nr:glycosyltransferase family 2 protein [Nannocystaceae bacterium]
CNAGFAHVETEYVLFLNPDAVLEPDALRVMLAFMEAHPRCGLSGPAMLYPGGGLQAAGMLLTPSGVIKAAAGLGLRAFPTRREIEPGSAPFITNWVCGACMLLPTAVYREVGMMDSRFFLYFEETDLCQKIRAHGYEIFALGEAVIGHEGGASAKDSGRTLNEGCIAEFFFASRYYYLTKNFGRVPAVASELGELALLAGRTLFDRARRMDRNLLRERLEGPVFRAPKRL